jgi:hypothetical protein
MLVDTTIGQEKSWQVAVPFCGNGRFAILCLTMRTQAFSCELRVIGNAGGLLVRMGTQGVPLENGDCVMPFSGSGFRFFYVISWQRKRPGKMPDLISLWTFLKG